jgi:hypothetical protein
MKFVNIILLLSCSYSSIAWGWGCDDYEDKLCLSITKNNKKQEIFKVFGNSIAKKNSYGKRGSDLDRELIICNIARNKCIKNKNILKSPLFWGAIHDGEYYYLNQIADKTTLSIGENIELRLSIKDHIPLIESIIFFEKNFAATFNGEPGVSVSRFMKLINTPFDQFNIEDHIYIDDLQDLLRPIKNLRTCYQSKNTCNYSYQTIYNSLFYNGIDDASIESKLELISYLNNTNSPFLSLAVDALSEIIQMYPNRDESKLLLSKIQSKIYDENLSYVLLDKTYLYDKPTDNSKTKMYLIKEDIVNLIKQEIDSKGRIWLQVIFERKGKKDIIKWLPASSVEIFYG